MHPPAQVRARRGHHDRHVAARADPRAQVEAVAVGQHEIEQDEIHSVIQLCQRLRHARRARSRESMPTEQITQGPRHSVVIFDDQHPHVAERYHSVPQTDRPVRGSVKEF